MEHYFSILFVDIKHERSSKLLLSKTDPDIIKQSKFTDDEISILKNFSFRKVI